jgi:hypothetical protein
MVNVKDGRQIAGCAIDLQLSDLRRRRMCHHGRIKLSADDREEVKKLSGIMVPVYATAMLALIGFVVVTGGSRQGELVASTTASAR